MPQNIIASTATIRPRVLRSCTEFLSHPRQGLELSRQLRRHAAFNAPLAATRLLLSHLPLVSGERRNGKNMEIIRMGYIGTTVRIHSFIPSQMKVRSGK